MLYVEYPYHWEEQNEDGTTTIVFSKKPRYTLLEQIEIINKIKNIKKEIKQIMLKKIIQTIIDLGLAFLLIKICVDDSSSYIAGLCTMFIWFMTDKLFKKQKIKELN